VCGFDDDIAVPLVLADVDVDNGRDTAVGAAENFGNVADVVDVGIVASLLVDEH